DARGIAHEADHRKNADGKEYPLQEIDAVVAEIEQDGEGPAAGECRTEHFRADEDAGADDGEDVLPVHLRRTRAGGGGGRRFAHGVTRWRRRGVCGPGRPAMSLKARAGS